MLPNMSYTWTPKVRKIIAVWLLYAIIVGLGLLCCILILCVGSLNFLKGAYKGGLGFRVLDLGFRVLGRNSSKGRLYRGVL